MVTLSGPDYLLKMGTISKRLFEKFWGFLKDLNEKTPSIKTNLTETERKKWQFIYFWKTSDRMRVMSKYFKTHILKRCFVFLTWILPNVYEARSAIVMKLSL